MVEGIDSIARVVMGGGWRMPTRAEWVELRDNTYYSWQAGVDRGWLWFDPKYVSRPGIRLVAAGYLDRGTPYKPGTLAWYWGSTLVFGAPGDEFGGCMLVGYDRPDDWPECFVTYTDRFFALSVRGCLALP